MATKKQRVAGILKRFQFIDLARAVAARGADRRLFLSTYTRRKDGRFPTYEPFRRCIAGIYGVERGLDTTPRPSRAQLTEAVRRECGGLDEDMNLGAFQALMLLVEEDDFRAFEVTEKSLRLALDRRCFFRLAHYLVRDERLVFQFPYPRRSRLSDYEFSIMMALIRFAYAKDDYEAAIIEIADLSCEVHSITVEGKTIPAPRSPRVLLETDVPTVDRGLLQFEIEDVYRVLMEISEEPGD